MRTIVRLLIVLSLTLAASLQAATYIVPTDRDLVMRSGCGLLMVTHSARLAAMLDRRLHLSGGLLA